MVTSKNIIVNTCPECKRKISVENITFYLLKNVQNIISEIRHIVQFGRPQSGSVFIQLLNELDVSCNLIWKWHYQNRLESKAMRFSIVTNKIACHIAHILKIYNRR